MLSGWLVCSVPFSLSDIYVYSRLPDLLILFHYILAPCERPEFLTDDSQRTGFGYRFDALPPPSEVNANTNDTPNELANAFSVIFAAADKLDVFTILQIWFPFLRRFVSFLLPPLFIIHEQTYISIDSPTIQQRNNSTTQQARATLRRIGLQLIEERRSEVIDEMRGKSGVAAGGDGEKSMLGRDLLSVLGTSLSPSCLALPIINP